MKTSNFSKKYIKKYILDYFYNNKIEFKNTNNNDIYKYLYKDIKDAYSYVLELSNTDCMKGILYNEKQIKYPNNLSNYFISYKFINYIKNYGKKQITFKCSMFNKQIFISFMIFSNNELDNLDLYQKYAEYMYTWLYICNKYSSINCANTLNIYIYHTPFNKKIENKKNILSPEHINSAYTSFCVKNGEIVIYRKEEWFKVFIHETLHIYGFDLSNYNYNNLIDKIKNIFPIKSNFYITETYSEVWARIINCAFVSFLSMKSNHKISDFYNYFDLLLQIEKIFSLKQAINVLDYMGISYEDLYKNNKESILLRDSLYNENTNVFCYYILSCIFMNNFEGFLSLCKDINFNINNNYSIIKFYYSNNNIDKLYKYIKSIYKCKDLLNNISNIKKNKNDNTFRMSIIDLKF